RGAAIGRPAEYMRLVEVVEAIDQLAIAVGMAAKRHAELFGRRVIRKERRIVEIAGADIGYEVRGAEAELVHAALELADHRFRAPGRGHRDRQKNVFAVLDEARHPVVVEPGAFAAEAAQVGGGDG